MLQLVLYRFLKWGEEYLIRSFRRSPVKSDSPLPHVWGNHLCGWKGLGLISI